MSDDAEKLEEGWYWVRAPGATSFMPGEYTHGHDNDWVAIIGYAGVFDADLFEIGPRIQPHEGDGK